MDGWLNANGEAYDPRRAIAAWQGGDESAGQELFDELYHQGTVNTASYAAVAGIVTMIAATLSPDWNAYALLAAIEEGRLNTLNPALPPELQASYRSAWENVLPKALVDLRDVTDDPTVRSILAVVAHAKGQHTLATIALCTEDERVEMLSG